MTDLPPSPFTDSGEPVALSPDEAAALVCSHAPGAAAEISDSQDVPARMQESSDCWLARDDEKPDDTMQESRPAHPATALSETDCIGEIFIGARKLENPEARFVLNVEQFMLDIEEPPLFLRRAGNAAR